MKITGTLRAYLQLHFCIFLWGFTAILGKWIDLSGLTLVWWRLLLTCASLVFLVRFQRLRAEISRKLLWQLAGIGVLVALHWVAFYGAIKFANASVALVCMATTSFFAAIIEPVIVRRSFRLYELLLGLLIVPGMILIVQELNLSMRNGIWAGLLAALLAATFSSLNKKIITKVEAIPATFIELGSGLLFLSVLMPIYWGFADTAPPFLPTAEDFKWLLVLAFFCTTIPFVLSLVTLRQLSAFSAALALNMEPVYGIFLAWVLLHENKELSPSFYTGGLIIIVAVFTHPFLKKHFDKKNKPV